MSNVTIHPRANLPDTTLYLHSRGYNVTSVNGRLHVEPARVPVLNQVVQMFRHRELRDGR